REHLNGNQVSDKLGKILDRLAETVFKKRYQSVAEVWADLQGYSGRKNSTNTTPQPVVIKTPPKPPTQKFE
ncbi:MAG: serine/threonine protein kinase, partial [Arthrospira platensis]